MVKKKATTDTVIPPAAGREQRVVAEAKAADSGAKIPSASAKDAFLLMIFYSIAD